MSVKRWQPDRPQFFTTAGAMANGYRLFFYTAGTSTKQNTFTDNTGVTPNSNYLTLDSTGRPSTEIWLTTGVNYKVVFATPGTDDPPNTIIWSEDNVSGIDDPGTSTTSEWQASGLTATYISASSFSLSGDRTATFTVGRRLKAAVTGGTSYSTVTASSYVNPTTTVTVDVAGSTALDSGLNTAILYYSIIDPANTSISPDSTHIKGTAVVAAATTNIWTAGGDFIHITGSTGITSFGTAVKVGQQKTLIFDGTPTLTTSSNLVLPSNGGTIAVAANDRAVVVADTTTKAIVTSYIPAIGVLSTLNNLTEDTAPSISADFIPTYDTSAATIKKVKPSSFIPLVLLRTQTASSSSVITFMNGASGVVFDNTYDEYVVLISGVRPSAGGAYPLWRVSLDGSTFKTGGTDYIDCGGGFDSAAATFSTNGNNSGVSMAETGTGLNTSSTRSFQGQLHIYTPYATTHKFVDGHATYYDAATNYASIHIGGAYVATTDALAGFQFIMSSGNIAAGTFALYGVRKS